jgi:hypothetical protein
MKQTASMTAIKMVKMHVMEINLEKPIKSTRELNVNRRSQIRNQLLGGPLAFPTSHFRTASATITRLTVAHAAMPTRSLLINIIKVVGGSPALAIRTNGASCARGTRCLLPHLGHLRARRIHSSTTALIPRARGGAKQIRSRGATNSVARPILDTTATATA